jgi:S-DNA-T family DNA segregation ATPase FtsK/SpoIIIE
VVTTRRRSAPRRSPARSTPKAQAKPTRASARNGRGKAATEEAPREGLLAQHSSDLWAIGLITLGVLLGLAVYGRAAGAVGGGVDRGLGSLVGVARFILPALCVTGGVLIVAGRHRVDPLRTALGAFLGLVAVAGLAELAGGSPRFGADAAALRGAGGWLGVAVGRPLQTGVGTAGATVILVAAVAVGVVLATGVSLATLARGISAGAHAGGRYAVRWWGGVTSPQPEPEPEHAPEDVEETTPVFDAAPSEPTPTPADTGQLAAVTDEPSPAPEDIEEPPPMPADSRPAQPAMGPAPGEWRLPPLETLKRSKEERQDEGMLDAAGEALVHALAAHGVETRLAGRTVGPSVTRFELELGPGVKVSRVTSLQRDIAYAMASPDVRLLAPIPGRSAIGVEVPNRRRQLVSLGDILTSPEAAAAHHPLEVALGRDIAGRSVMVNLADMPHVLISGATGSGKSSCINSLISSVLMRATPDQVRMILVDPKRVELGQYNGLPHLLTPVVVDPKKAANALTWAVKEMERRYDLLAEYGVRDITGYNEAHDAGDLGPTGGPSVEAQVAEVAARARARAKGSDAPSDAADEADAGDDAEDGDPAEPVADVEEESAERLPYVLVVVDELNDLMMVAARDVEDSVCRIAQMARAVGIHLVLATQRPSVDVITGVIKANIPSRLAFSVSSLADSRVILDQPGAERLIGKGDLLLLNASSSVPRRLQAPWVSEAEVRQLVGWWRRQGRTPEHVVAISNLDESAAPGHARGDDDDDELLQAAMELVVRSQLGSTSMLQRKLRVGFARAGRLMDLLERRGVVGPSEGSKARAVLMTPEELDRIP